MIRQYHVRWRWAHSQQVNATKCLTEDGYSTVDDFPTMIAYRFGGTPADVVVRSYVVVRSWKRLSE